jgi:signal transduction histidine kinase
MEQPPTDELRKSSRIDLGAALLAAKQNITAQWREEVRRVLPGADELTRKQLDDSLPELLDRIAVALSTDQPDATESLQARAPEHGATRYHQDFSINQLLVEYQILRRITMHEMSRALGRDLRVSELMAINEAIDLAMNPAVVAFVDHQARAIQSETAALTKFLSFISHDLRGGLNGAMLMIEVLKRQLQQHPNFAEAVEELDVVRRSILETVGTMERFLYAERLRLGKMPVAVADVSVQGLLADVQKNAMYLLQDAGMQLVASVQPEDLTIASDRQLLVMVLQNLISNAIKYGRRGEVRVEATTPPGMKCRFSVVDHGPGIAPEKLSDLFAAFARGETYGQKGVGLGLYIAKQATDLLGGQLSVESQPGKGSTFYLDLPA